MARSNLVDEIAQLLAHGDEVSEGRNRKQAVAIGFHQMFPQLVDGFELLWVAIFHVVINHIAEHLRYGLIAHDDQLESFLV